MQPKNFIHDLGKSGQTKVAWYSLYIAVFALVASLASLYESHQARVTMVQDELTFNFQQYDDGSALEFEVIKGGRIYPGIIMKSAWDTLISNTGTSTLSIIRYEIFQVKPNSLVAYSKLDKGLSSKDGKPLSLPIVLDTGKSIRININIGIRPGIRAYKIYTNNMNNQLDLTTYRKILFKNNIDIYDNPVGPLILNNEVVEGGTEIFNRDKEQVFEIRLYTARGGIFSKTSSWYPLKKTLTP